MATKILLLLLLTYCISFVFGQNVSNVTIRNYTIGIKVSSIWYSGSGDTMYFKICNDDLTITNTSTVQDTCLEWFQISSGMENRGDWYYFNYNFQANIGTITSMKLLTKTNDQFCISKVSVDGIKYDSSNAVCMEVADHKEGGSCAVISIDLKKTIFESNLFEGTDCIEDVSNAVTSPPIAIPPGSKTYSISLTVSNLFYSGTKNPLYLRLCTDKQRTDCTMKCDDYVALTNCESDWFEFAEGVNEEGNTYKGFWNTKNISNVKYADIVIFGPDKFCLSRLKVDNYEADAGNIPECISDDTKDGCATLLIDIVKQEFDETSVDICSYGIMSNATFVSVDQYIFKFKTGSLIACGAEAPIFFLFCTVDGDYRNNKSCSKIYEIGGEMPDEDKEYTFTIDIRNYPIFNTVNDIYSIHVWEYETEYWCLSDITVTGKILETDDNPGDITQGFNVDSGTPSITIESPVDDGAFCTGVRVQVQNNQWEKFNDGPIPQNTLKKCRWNTYKDAQGTIKVSKKSDNETILDWMNKGYNWVYICVVLIVIVICCIVGCACLQAMTKKKKAEIEDTNRPWHGGNSAFYG